MPVSRKKVIVRKFSRDWLSGYLPPSGFVVSDQVEMLDLAGKLVSLSLTEVKWICFVRDFQSGDAQQPERLLRKTFATRPRSQGLWVRARLKDNDMLEGLAQNDISLLEGLFLVPPDTRSNTQRIYLPRQAVTELEILAVIKAGARREATGAETAQESLFQPES
jgi:Family of unknown function (DUF6982)